MKPGDAVQIKQTDHAIVRQGQDPEPREHWIYATVVEPIGEDNGAFVEVNHPGNIAHGHRIAVSRKNIRTIDDLEAMHEAHPHREVENPSYDKEEHKSLINLRAAIARIKPPEEPAA